MHRLKYIVLAGMALAMALAGPRMRAQITVQIGPPPVCPYGYFDYPPYDCAPYGYYGPEWFVNGAFLGAGPWYRGPEHFWGHVDNHFDHNDGFRGEYPRRGTSSRPPSHENFRGNEMRDGHGHSNLGQAHEHGEHGHNEQEHGH